MLTAAGFYLRYLLDALKGLGWDATSFVQDLGVTPEVLTDSSGRVSLDVIDALFVAAGQRAELLSHGPLSVALGAAVTPVALDVLAYASMSSGRLGDAIRLMCEFEPYRLGFAQCELDEATTQPGMAMVALNAQGTWPSLPLQIEAALAGWVSFGRWITGAVSRPSLIEFAHLSSGETAPYERFFQCPVRFGQSRNAVHIERSLLMQALPASNQDVYRLMREEIQCRVTQYAKGEQFLVRLEQVIESCLAGGAPSTEAVAGALGVSPRQFRAMASSAGTTLTQELDAVRRRLARRWLTSGVPLAEISHRLGYSEQSAFNRACVRWFGLSPGRLRADQD